MKKYKNSKKSTLYKIPMMYYQYEIQCPFCMTILVNAVDSSTIKFRCSQCDNKIEVLTIIEKKENK